MKIIAIGKGTGIEGDDVIGQSPKNIISIKRGCLKFLDPFTFSNCGSGDLSTTITSFPTLYANGLEDEIYNKKIAND